jgi:outer membrane protein assembly factor BamB
MNYRSAARVAAPRLGLAPTAAALATFAALAFLLLHPAASNAAHARGPIVSTASTSLGRVLVDSRGHTLYLFGKDKHGKSACTGMCTAIDAATGNVLWQNKLPSMDFGAATVANDVVFTSTYAGTIYAFDTQTGKTLWTATAPAGINSFPAIDGDTLLVGAAAPGFLKNPQFQLIAYSLQ